MSHAYTDAHTREGEVADGGRQALRKHSLRKSNLCEQQKKIRLRKIAPARKKTSDIDTNPRFNVIHAQTPANQQIHRFLLCKCTHMTP